MIYSVNNKIYIVRSYFEDFAYSCSNIIGLFNDKKVADETAKKWEDFYEEKKYIFNEPKGWKPSVEDLEYGYCTWQESIEYSERYSKYVDILNFKEIEVEEIDINKDISLNNSFIGENLMSLMTQWDRNYKLEKIIK